MRTTATARKTAGSMIQLGGPVVVPLEKKISESPDRSTVTGKALTNPIRPSRTMGEYSGIGRGGRSGAAARRKPSPIPRNEPRSTKFEKYARWTMFAPSHRISESSINSISALPRSSRTRGGMRAQHARADLTAAKRRGAALSGGHAGRGRGAASHQRSRRPDRNLGGRLVAARSRSGQRRGVGRVEGLHACLVVAVEAGHRAVRAATEVVGRRVAEPHTDLSDQSIRLN